jgi:hypothetical protein
MWVLAFGRISTPDWLKTNCILDFLWNIWNSIRCLSVRSSKRSHVAIVITTNLTHRILTDLSNILIRPWFPFFLTQPFNYANEYPSSSQVSASAVTDWQLMSSSPLRFSPAGRSHIILSIHISASYSNLFTSCALVENIFFRRQMHPSKMCRLYCSPDIQNDIFSRSRSNER